MAWHLTVDRKLFVGGLDWSTTQGEFHRLTPASAALSGACMERRIDFFPSVFLQVVCFFRVCKLQIHIGL